MREFSFSPFIALVKWPTALEVPKWNFFSVLKILVLVGDSAKKISSRKHKAFRSNTFCQHHIRIKTLLSAWERYSLSGDQKVYPVFWKAFTTPYVNLDLESWPVPLTRTVVDDCGERETS